MFTNMILYDVSILSFGSFVFNFWNGGFKTVGNNQLAIGRTYFHDSVRKICIVGNISTLIVSCEKIQYVFS